MSVTGNWFDKPGCIDQLDYCHPKSGYKFVVCGESALYDRKGSQPFSVKCPHCQKAWRLEYLRVEKVGEQAYVHCVDSCKVFGIELVTKSRLKVWPVKFAKDKSVKMEFKFYPKMGEYNTAIIAERKVKDGKLSYENFHIEKYCQASEGWSGYEHSNKCKTAFDEVEVNLDKVREIMCKDCLQFLEAPTQKQIRAYISDKIHSYHVDIWTPAGWMAFWIAQDGGERVVLEKEVAASTVSIWLEVYGIAADPAAQRLKMLKDAMKGVKNYDKKEAKKG